MVSNQAARYMRTLGRLLKMIRCPNCLSSIEEAIATPQSKLIKLRDGEVVLYRRGGLSKWQTRFKLPNNSWHRMSTKRSNLEEAKRVAAESYDRARFRQAEGMIPVSRRFREVANFAITTMDKLTEAGKGKVIFKDYKQAIVTYLIPFFGSKPINTIAQEDIEQLESWREQKMARAPAASTIMNHNAALNRVFDTAIACGWMSRKDAPVLKNKGVKGQRRPDFTLDDWRRVTANLTHWSKKAKDERPKKMRELLRDYVLILANTGIRPGKEADNIKWKQIRWHRNASGERNLMILVSGKTGQRELVARHGCEAYLKRIQSRFPDLASMSFDDLLKAQIDQYVFRLRDGKRTRDLYHTFNEFLTEHGLVNDSQGNRRSLYSLRHMYATMRLTMDGGRVSMHQLAKQMGTSIGMLEKHYSHLEPILIADVLAGKKYERKLAEEGARHDPKIAENKQRTGHS